MPRDVKLPQLGQTMEEGTIVTALVKEGDKVARGDVLFEIETDKATLEMESPADGYVKKFLIEVGQTVPINTPILILGEQDEQVGDEYIRSLQSQGGGTVPAPAQPAPSTAEQTQAASAGAAGTPAGLKVVRLPQLGQTMEEGTVVTALIKTGDKVEKGDVLFEIETDKATLEMESPAEGYVKSILVGVGETVPINTPILVLGGADDAVPQSFVDSLRQGGAVAPAPMTPQPGASQTVQPSAAAAGPVPAPPSAKVVRLPQLGQTMEEGTIVTALVKEGDKVGKGDVLFEIETDKATLEMESPAEGYAKKVLIEVGQTVPINTPILILADQEAIIPQPYVDWVLSQGGGAAAPTTEAVSAPAAPAAADVAVRPAAPPAPSPAPMGAGERVFASPRAKMVAAELGVDLRQVPLAAGAVRLTEADVRKAAQARPMQAAAATAAATGAAPQAPEPEYRLGQKVPINRLKRIVGEKMLASKREIPCFYLNIRVDMTDLVKFRAGLNRTSDVKVSFNDFIIKAVAMGLKHYPIMTGQIAGDAVQLADSIDIGLAIATPQGLVAPIIRDAYSKSLREIALYSKGLIDRARAEKLSLDDLSGGCITISNLGGFGIDSFIPIVVPGQTSILGVGRIADTCVPMDGNIMVRKVMNLNLSVDHKVANGADGAQFLDFIKKTLEHTANFE